MFAMTTVAGINTSKAVRAGQSSFEGVDGFVSVPSRTSRWVVQPKIQVTSSRFPGLLGKTSDLKLNHEN